MTAREMLSRFRLKGWKTLSRTAVGEDKAEGGPGLCILHMSLRCFLLTNCFQPWIISFQGRAEAGTGWCPMIG